MRILVRLPNWLGDMVMSVAFIKEVKRQFPDSKISVIVKKGLHPLLQFFPPLQQQFIFSKEEYKGLAGLYRFGNMIRQQQKPDLFFCLPDSFSSALMGWVTGAQQRAGYKNELRSIFLTHSFIKNKTLHRVDQYLDLLYRFTGQSPSSPEVLLQNKTFSPSDTIVVNFNSEASSRRLPLSKAVSLLNVLRNSTHKKIILVGGASDAEFVNEIFSKCPPFAGISNLAGKTSLPELMQLMQEASAVLSTDSGPAHAANALQTPTVVLFGAGNEYSTAPYNKFYCSIIRLGQLPCEPCVNNECKLYGSPRCLELLDETMIVQKLLSVMR